MSLRYSALPAAEVARIRAGGLDAYGFPAERGVSDGSGLPCRHCLADIPEGRAMFTLAWRPFPVVQPYAETGPIFLCADCTRRDDGPRLPPILAARPRAMLRGYGPDHRIVYGTGAVVETATFDAACAERLERPDVAYLHLRSASNGCYLLRIDRAEA